MTDALGTAGQRLVDQIDQTQAQRRADEARVRANVARAALWSPPLGTVEPPPQRTRYKVTTEDVGITITRTPGEPRGPLPLRISLWWLRVRLWGMRARLATTPRIAVLAVLLGPGAAYLAPAAAVTMAGGDWNFSSIPSLMFAVLMSMVHWWNFTRHARRTLKEMS